MIAEKISLDTNILIYAFDTSDKIRHKRAMSVIEKAMEADCVLTLQALSEFYYASTRKKYLTAEVALDQINDWQTIFPIVTAKTGTLVRAIDAVKKYKMAFWDAMLWSTAHDAGVQVLLSEDFNHHQQIAGIKIVNPFKDEGVL